MTDELLARVAPSRFVAVVGASGAGKTSLVQAGLLTALDARLDGRAVGPAAGDPNAQLEEARAGAGRRRRRTAGGCS